MSLTEHGLKPRDTSDLSNWRMSVIDDGSIRINGITKHGFKKEIQRANIVEVTTTHIVVAYEGMMYLFYKDIDWSKPLVPTRMLKKVLYKNCQGYAIVDLLGEASKWAMYLQDDLDLLELQQRYPAMYDNIDMDEVVETVVVAIRQKDSK